MKRLVLSMLLIACAMFAKAQLSNTWHIGDDSAYYIIHGMPATETAFKFKTTFADTTALNSAYNGRIKQTPFALAVAGGVLWLRDSTATYWALVNSTAAPINGLTAATGTNTINNTSYLQSWSWNSLTGNALELKTNSTTAASTQTMLYINMLGAHAFTGQPTYGIQSINAHTGTTSTNYGVYGAASGASTNVGGYFSASGGTSHALKIIDGSEGNLKILQSDANGNTTWVAPSGIVAQNLANTNLTQSNVDRTYTIPTGKSLIFFGTNAGILFDINVGNFDVEGNNINIEGTGRFLGSTENTKSGEFTAFDLYDDQYKMYTNDSLVIFGADTAGSVKVTIPSTGVTTFDARGSAPGFVFSDPVTLANLSIATTQSAGDNSTKVATTAYVATAVASGGTSPAGNYGNVQLNRNSTFATPASDSLGFSGGLSVKGIGTFTGLLTGTEAAFVSTATTGNGHSVTSSTITSGNLVSLFNTGTAATGNSKTVLNIATSGANATSTQSTWGLDVSNTNTGTNSTNIAARFSASGGATNNTAILAAAGNVVIGQNTLGYPFEVYGTSNFGFGYSRSATAVASLGNASTLRIINSGSTVSGWLACYEGGLALAHDADIIIAPGGVDAWRFKGTGGHLIPQTANTYDLGSSSLGIRTGYFGTSIFNPLLIGGIGTTSTLIYKTTTGSGTTGADHIFQVGNNGATEAMRILNNGRVGVGIAAPLYQFDVSTASVNAAAIGIYGANSGGNNEHIEFDALATDNTTRQNYASIYVNNTSRGVGTQSGTMDFYTTNSGSSNVRLRISPAGAIAIANTSPDASAQLDIVSTTKGLLIPRMTNTQMAAVSSPATGLSLYNTDAKASFEYNGASYQSTGIVSGSYNSGAVVAQTTFTVTFGGTQPNATYHVNVAATNLLGAAVFYVNNKTTTTFDVVYLSGLTGTLTFDYQIAQ